MVILKIGGGHHINLEGIADDLQTFPPPYIIVHGANALRDELAARLGIEKRILTSVSGYTSVYSDADALDVLMMAYAGLRNKRLVELCQQRGINAIGLTGLDGRIIQGRRNRGIRIQDGEKIRIVRDFSGKPRQVNTALLKHLLQEGYVPVLTVPIADETGTAINSENDDIVTLLQGAMGATRVIHFIEAPGLLADPHRPESVIPRLGWEELARWEARAEGRMKRKLRALLQLKQQQVEQVILADGRVKHPLQEALNENGTVIQ